MTTEPNRQGQAPIEGAPPQDPSQPEPVTKEQLEQTVADLRKQHEAQLQKERDFYKERETQLINSLNNQNTQRQPAAATPRVSKEEALLKLNEEGDASSVVEYFESQLQTTRQTYEQQLKELQKTGGSQISSLAIQQAKADSSMPHFSRYEDEIISAVNNSGSTDPAMVREAYKYVVGTHMDEIIKEEKEKMLRQAVDEGTLVPGGAKNGRGDPVNSGPKPEERYSERALSLLEKKEISVDQFHQKLGKSMPFYKYEEGANGNVKRSRTQAYKEGFKEEAEIKEENTKLEEEFQWM